MSVLGFYQTLSALRNIQFAVKGKGCLRLIKSPCFLVIRGFNFKTVLRTVAETAYF